MKIKSILSRNITNLAAKHKEKKFAYLYMY